MTDEAFARYFAEREQFERAMSERAKRVADVHGEMAQRYEALAKVFGAAAARPSLRHDHELLPAARRAWFGVGDQRQVFPAGIVERVVAVDEAAAKARGAASSRSSAAPSGARLLL